MCKLSFGFSVCVLTVLAGCATSPSLPSLPKFSLPKPDLSGIPNPLAKFRPSTEDSAHPYATPKYDFSEYAPDSLPANADAGLTATSKSETPWTGGLRVPGSMSRSRLDEGVNSRVAAMEALGRQHEAEAARILSDPGQGDPRILGRMAAADELDRRAIQAAQLKSEKRGFWSRLWNRGSDNPEQLAAQPTVIR